MSFRFCWFRLCQVLTGYYEKHMYMTMFASTVQSSLCNFFRNVLLRYLFNLSRYFNFSDELKLAQKVNPFPLSFAPLESAADDLTL